MQKKIAFINGSKSWGGGEKWHLEYAKGLFEADFKVTLITNEVSALASKARAKGLPVFSFKTGKLSFLNPFKIIKTIAFLRENNFTTILLNLPSDLKLFGIASFFANIPKVIYRRGSAIPIKNTFLNRFLLNKCVTRIIANSESTKRTILENGVLKNSKKIKVIYNGLDLSKFESQSFQRINAFTGIVIGNLGRMVEQKNQKDLVDLAKILRMKGLNFKIIIGGTGKLQYDLMDIVENLGFEKQFVFLGEVENIRDFFESIDIFVLPSKWEGFGYVIAEAMASYKPVIAYNLSSNPELIDNNRTGFLIEPFDINEVSERIIQLAGDPDLRMRMGIQGRKKVEAQFQFQQSLESLKNTI